MTTLPSTTYRPREGSLASQVLGFFVNNPDEELDLEAITEKFDASRGNIHTLLGGCIDAGLLVRDRNKDGEWIYKPGRAGPKEVDMDRVHKTKAKPKATSGFKAPRKDIDLSALTVDDDVPYTTARDKGHNKWQPMFDKLTKPGQSIALPLEVQGAVAAVANKINKLKTQGTYRVAKVNATTCRVWRIAQKEPHP